MSGWLGIPTAASSDAAAAWVIDALERRAPRAVYGAERERGREGERDWFIHALDRRGRRAVYVVGRGRKRDKGRMEQERREGGRMQREGVGGGEGGEEGRDRDLRSDEPVGPRVRREEAPMRPRLTSI